MFSLQSTLGCYVTLWSSFVQFRQFCGNAGLLAEYIYNTYMSLSLYIYVHCTVTNIQLSWPQAHLTLFRWIWEKWLWPGFEALAPLYLPLLQGNCLYLHFYNILICILYCIYIIERIIAFGYIGMLKNQPGTFLTIRFAKNTLLLFFLQAWWRREHPIHLFLHIFLLW